MYFSWAIIQNTKLNPTSCRVSTTHFNFINITSTLQIKWVFAISKVSGKDTDNGITLPLIIHLSYPPASTYPASKEAKSINLPTRHSIKLINCESESSGNLSPYPHPPLPSIISQIPSNIQFWLNVNWHKIMIACIYRLPIANQGRFVIGPAITKHLPMAVAYTGGSRHL